MKQIIFLTAIVCSTLFSVTAQPKGKPQPPYEGKDNTCCIPNLTDDQKNQMEKLKLDFTKSMNLYRADLAELKAQLNKLMLADQPDTKSITNVVNKIGAKKTEVLQAEVNQRLAIRKLLTEEQKVIFDAQKPGMERHKGKKPGPNHMKDHKCAPEGDRK